MRISSESQIRAGQRKWQEGRKTGNTVLQIFQSVETIAAPREAEKLINYMLFSQFSKKHHCVPFNYMFTSVNFLWNFGGLPQRRQFEFLEAEVLLTSSLPSCAPWVEVGWEVKWQQALCWGAASCWAHHTWTLPYLLSQVPLAGWKLFSVCTAGHCYSKSQHFLWDP